MRGVWGAVVRQWSTTINVVIAGLSGTNLVMLPTCECGTERMLVPLLVEDPARVLSINFDRLVSLNST